MINRARRIEAGPHHDGVSRLICMGLGLIDRLQVCRHQAARSPANADSEVESTRWRLGQSSRIAISIVHAERFNNPCSLLSDVQGGLFLGRRHFISCLRFAAIGEPL